MFFKDCINVQEVKNQYRKLCFQYHPDTGHGDEEVMKKINIAYHEKLNSFDGQTAKGTDGKDHTYKYNEAVEQEIMDKINELLRIKIQNNTDWTIELIGTWIWISGTKRNEKDLLNKNGAKCKWHGKHGMWYWRKYSYKKRASNKSIDQIREAYGSQTFSGTQGAMAAAD
jgi:hypothetical protein